MENKKKPSDDLKFKYLNYLPNKSKIVIEDRMPL